MVDIENKQSFLQPKFLSSNVTTIDIDAFTNTILKYVEIPAQVEAINNIAFSDLTTLTTLTFESNSKL